VRALLARRNDYVPDVADVHQLATVIKFDEAPPSASVSRDVFVRGILQVTVVA
jgi:hypothetical protein